MMAPLKVKVFSTTAAGLKRKVTLNCALVRIVTPFTNSLLEKMETTWSTPPKQSISHQTSPAKVLNTALNKPVEEITTNSVKIGACATTNEITW